MTLIEIIPNRPKTEAEIAERKHSKSATVIEIAKRFGDEYFDGQRRFGYGGYIYDGRWNGVADKLINLYQLRPDSRILDVGCAKGFLVGSLLLKGMDAFGLDISDYALEHCLVNTVGRLHWGSAKRLPFPKESFDLVVSFNTLHNLPKWACIEAFREIQRVSRGKAFVQVDCYRDEHEYRRFHDWVLTAETYGFPYEWANIFEAAGYTGDHGWTIV